MKGILCAIDFSKASLEALKWSVELAKKDKIHLTVLYAYRLFNLKNAEALELKKNREIEAQKNFSSIEKDILIGKGVPYDFKSEVGFVVDRVNDHAKKNEVSFLVISKKMNSINKESFNELLDKVQIPLVIVP